MIIIYFIHMKQILILIIVSAFAVTLTSCGSYYMKVQDEVSRKGPVNCSGYHVKNATWNFFNNLDENIYVTGRCIKGMKHGGFDFFIEGKHVARTKFVRDNEVKTACFVNGKSKLDLNSCLALREQTLKNKQ